MLVRFQPIVVSPFRSAFFAFFDGERGLSGASAVRRRAQAKKSAKAARRGKARSLSLLLYARRSVGMRKIISHFGQRP